MLPDAEQSMALFQGALGSHLCCSEKSSVVMKTSVGYRWNDNDLENLKDLEKNLTQCHFVHCKCYVDWSGIERGPV
jgi:hypothetical protein